MRKRSDWLEEYKKRDAFWIHDRNPRRPHALLTSGLHSNGFANSSFFKQDDSETRALLEEATVYLLGEAIQSGYSIPEVGVVIGPQTGATKLAEFCARILGERRGLNYRYLSPKKIPGDQKRFELEEGAFSIRPEEAVLFVDDVYTTGSSLDAVERDLLDPVEISHDNILDFFCVFFNRSDFYKNRGRKIISLIHQPMQTWNPEVETCPLCAMGSQAIRPKEGINWNLLNAAY